MKPLDFPLLADENIQPAVVAALNDRGQDIRSVHGEGLTGHSDADLLRYAHAHGRVLLTHDRDFGRLAVLAGEPVVGIIYLRPGHISADFVLELIAALDASPYEVEPPFIVVAERKGDTVRVRVRGSP
jgi:predicted nuclease of predicted toxin-antitoxin system